MGSHFLSQIVTNILVLNYCDFLEFFVFVPRPSSYIVGRQKRYATSSHVQMTSFINVCDVRSAEKRYACFKIVINKLERK